MLKKLRFGLLIILALAFMSNNLFADREQDSLALVALYNATNGPNWKNNTNWLSSKPINEWSIVKLDQNGRVNTLFLYDNQLSGSIPKELSSLTKLTWLVLGRNQLSGEIPQELGNLTNLTILSLEFNQLSGSIPNELGNLTKLIEFDIWGNKLSGSIPKEFSNLTNLTYLWLKDNQFDFADLANVDNSFYQKLDYFEYSPQDRIGIEETLTKQEGESINIEAGDKYSEGNVYKWYKDGKILDNETNQNIEIQSLSLNDEGIYTCDVTNPDFPKLTLYRRPFKLNILATSVDNNVNIENLSIYPNPASDFINISVDNGADLLTREVQILNLLGLVVSKTAITDGNNRIDISNLPRGTYFIKIGDKVEKFVKM